MSPFTIEGGELKEHQNSETTLKGTLNVGTQYPYYNTFANGATIESVAITTTKKTCIIVVTSIFLRNISTQATQIKRGGVDKTKETTISGQDTNAYRVHLQYASEILDAGSFTYNLVNTFGSDIQVFAVSLKIVAVEA